MTKEELKQEAEDKADNYLGSINYDHGNVSDTPFSTYDVFVAYEKGAMDFAEPREKRIAELERKLEQTEKDLADYQFNYPTIKELQKENAELKDDNKVMADNYSKMEQKFYDNLTKAKEIIRSLYFVIQDRIDYKGNIPLEDEMYRAKQFLK